MKDDNGRDPLEDFFTAERDSVRPLHGDDARWTDIVAASRRSGRSWYGYAAGAAAAVVLVSAATWGLTAANRSTVTPVGSPQVTRTVLVTAPPTPGPFKSTTEPTPQATGGGGRTTAAPPLSTAPAAQSVPATFAVISVTTARAGLLYALGSTTCSGSVSPCTAVATSVDNGGSWVLVSSFPTSAAPSRETPGEVGPAATLSQIRFASPTVGWVYGGGIKQTHDGGRTWSDYEHGGGDVVDLATDGKDVVLTAADSCDTSVCHGDIRVLRAPVAASAAKDVAGTIPGGTGVRSADISWHRGKAIVTPVVDGAGADLRPQVVQPDGLHAVGSTGCANQAGAARIVAPASRDSTLYALCPAGSDAGHLNFGVARSVDLGASWTVAQAFGPHLVNAGVTSFAATDAKHLLAVSGGTADLHGTMTLSEDGGVTWREPRSAPAMPARGWAWVGAPGGSAYYAIPVGGGASYWLSKDHGDTWVQVRVAG